MDEQVAAEIRLRVLEICAKDAREQSWEAIDAMAAWAMSGRIPCKLPTEANNG